MRYAFLENAGFALYEDVLSKPLAYGASITLSDGILCIGGRDSSQCYEDVIFCHNAAGQTECFGRLAATSFSVV